MIAKEGDRKTMSALTDKQMNFCREYVTDSNATQAAIRAGYSSKTARSIGTRLLKKKEIQNKISSIQKEIAERAELEQSDLIDELRKIGFMDIDYSRIQIKDKLKALEIIAKMMGFDRPTFSGEIEDISEAESEIFE